MQIGVICTNNPNLLTCVETIFFGIALVYEFQKLRIDLVSDLDLFRSLHPSSHTPSCYSIETDL
jgi:hypothetical protein